MFGNHNDLIYFEQFVNDRRRSSPPPDISRELIPETSATLPMLWAVLPASEVKILSDHIDGVIPSYANGFEGEQGKVVYFPIHPLQLDAYRNHSIIESGKFRVSASYRTVFYEPTENDIVKLMPPPGFRLMFKLHLDESLPGIAGDRRLTPHIINKCLVLSRELTISKNKGLLNSRLSIAPEEIGLLHGDRGALIRRIPDKAFVPGFSLSSPDQRNANKEVLAATILKLRSRLTGLSAADLFGEVFAEPLIYSLFSAFRQGFSLEMHMQNFLLLFEDTGLIRTVFYRDLEGVIFSNSVRRARNLPDLFIEDSNPELHQYSSHITRYFNRNLDHDLGRFFDNLLVALERHGIFRPSDTSRAVYSVRKLVRAAIKYYGLEKWAFWPRLLRFSRTPYGNGRRPGHYYNCRFR